MFKNRLDAAHQLALKLKQYAGNPSAILLAIPRGALEIGAVLKTELDLPLDIIATKKIPAPGNEEYAIGSVGPDGSYEINEDVVRTLMVQKPYIEQQAKQLQSAIKKRYINYRGNKPLPDLKDKIAIVIDDGIATGFTVQAALNYIRSQKPKKIVLAVPVAASDSTARLKKMVDELICLEVRDDFFAVAQFYHSFPQVGDEQAKRLLMRG